MNWASSDFGAEIVSVSSEVGGCEASNVLVDDDSQIWLSEPGVLPQWLCISLLNIPRVANLEIRTIGWHCWHSYTTNPREIRLHVSKDGAKFRVWDTFSATGQQAGSQLFCCAPISASLYPYLALEVLTTFGGNQTYLNRISFFSEELSPASVGSADADYGMKSTLGFSPAMQLLGFDDGEDSKSDEQQSSPAAAANLELDLSQLTKEKHNVHKTENVLIESSKVGNSNDAFSVVQSITEDATHLQLQKALGFDDSIIDPASSLPSIRSSIYSPGGTSPASSRRNSGYRLPRSSSSASSLDHQKKEIAPPGLTTTTSTNEKLSSGVFSHYSKVESLLTDSNMLATTSRPPLRSNSYHNISNNTATISSSSAHINNTNTSLVSTEIDLRLRELEHKFQTIVDLLQHNNGANSIGYGVQLSPPMPLAATPVDSKQETYTTPLHNYTSNDHRQHEPASPRSIGDSSSSKFQVPPPPQSHQEKPFLLSDMFLNGQEERRQEQRDEQRARQDDHRDHRSSIEVIRESIRDSLETIQDAGEKDQDHVQLWVDQILSEVRMHGRFNPLSSSDSRFSQSLQRDQLAEHIESELKDENYRYSSSHSQQKTTPIHVSSHHTMSNNGYHESADEELDRLVQELHQCVLQKTIKEAQLKLLNPAYRSKPSSPI